MIALRTRIRGLQEFIEANKKTIVALSKGDLTVEIAKKTKNRAKYRAPRKKGKLIRSIHYKIEGSDKFTITCEAVNEYGEDYPSILEWGSRFIPVGTPENPRIIISGGGKTAFLPYMRWALWRTLQEIDIIFKEKILKHYK